MGSPLRLFRLRAFWLTDAAILALLGLLSSVFVLSAPSSAGATANRASVHGWGFDDPSGIAGDASHLYVANFAGGTLDVLSLAKGSLTTGESRQVRVWYGSGHGFSVPTALALDRGTLWVLAYSANPYLARSQATLTGLNASTGRAEHEVGLYTSASLPFSDRLGTVAVHGPDLFVSDPGGDKVIELDAISGRLVRDIEGSQYHFAAPSALVTAGPDLFVANGTGPGGGSVTELDATTGRVVQVISGPQFHFERPSALAVWGPDLFVVNAGPALRRISASVPLGSITEVDTYASSSGPEPTSIPTDRPASMTTTASAASTTGARSTTTGSSLSGPRAAMTSETTASPRATASATKTSLPTASPAATLVRVISGPASHLEQPGAATVSAGKLLVTTDTGASGALVVLDAASGRLAEVLDRPSCRFAAPSALAAEGGDAFVASDGGVTEVRAGHCTSTDEGSPYGFHDPGASAVADGHLFVANMPAGPAGGTVTELDASTGALVRVIPEPAGMDGLIVALAADGHRLYIVSALAVAEVSTLTGAVHRFSLSLADDATGAVLNGATLYICEAEGGLVALGTVDGHVRQLVGENPAAPELIALGGLPAPMVFVGDDLFYLKVSPKGSAFVNEVNEVDTATGKLIRAIVGPQYHLELFSQMAVWGGDIFVSGPVLPVRNGGAVLKAGAGSVTELDAVTGKLVRLIAGPAYDFQSPEGVAIAHGDLFVADTAANAVTEVDPRNGRLVGVMTGAPYQFSSPGGLPTYGRHLFVLNEAGASITDIDL